MYARLFLGAALLCCCSGGALENSSSERILAFAGETAILPCRIDVGDDIPTVEWAKEGLVPDIVFLYRDGSEMYEMKNPAFRFRTNLFMNKLNNGNASLRISNVQLTDAGKYICKMIRGKPREVATVELVVGAVSEPKLSLVPTEDGGVTLQCESSCWFPEPMMIFLDEQGINISAGDPKSDLDSRGCFTVTQTVTVQTAYKRITCRVHQPNINQMKVTDIHIPADCMRSCTQTTIAVVVAIVLCSALFALFFLYKIFGNSVGGQKAPVPQQSSGQSTAHSNAEVHPQRSQADNDAAAELQRKVDELMLRLDGKEEIIRTLTEELKDLRSNPSKSSPNVSQTINLPPRQFAHDNGAKPAASPSSNRPKSGGLPQRKDSKPTKSPTPGPQIQTSSGNLSRPALWTDDGAVSPSSSSALPSEKGHVGRSMSLSGPRQNIARPQRRNTISINNPFSVLENLSEDSEPLL